MFDRLFDNTSLPILQQVMAFSEHRQQVLADNVANIDTPGYRQTDLPVGEFTAALSEAISRRDAAGGAGRFVMKPTEHLSFGPTMQVRAEEIRGLQNYYDGGNRSVNRLMSEMGKNALWHSTAVELYRSQSQLLHTAIRERV